MNNSFTKHPKISIETCFLFLIGLFSSFCIKVIGATTISELISLLLFSYLFVAKKVSLIYGNKDIRTYTWLILLSAFSCFMSSVIINHDLSEMLKRIVIILLLIPGLFVLYWLLISKPYKVVYYLIGVIISDLLVRFYFPQFSDLIVNDRGLTIDEMDEILFYYTYAPYFTFIIALLYSKFSQLTIISIVGMGFMFLYGSSRANFLIYLFSAVILLLIGTKKSPLYIRTKIRKYKIFFFILIIITGFCISKTYTYFAATGKLGEAAKNKYEMQSSGNIGNLGGRSSFFRGLIAVMYHPIIGVVDPVKANIDDIQEITEDYIAFVGNDNEYITSYNSNNISGHSTIIDWWLSYGILALPFWIFLLIQCYICLTKYIFVYKPLTAYLLVGVISLVWDVFFSPFGIRIRYEIMIALMIIVKQYGNMNYKFKKIKNVNCYDQHYYSISQWGKFYKTKY
jgi:hypothetical protein